MSGTQDTTSRLAKVKRAASEELHKQGTPEYDPRSVGRLVEAERRATDELTAQGDPER